MGFFSSGFTRVDLLNRELKSTSSDLNSGMRDFVLDGSLGDLIMSGSTDIS